MFSRRHPFLFFILALSSLGVIAFTCLALLVAGTGRFVASSLPGELLPQGNIGIVEVTGVITSSREILETLADFDADDDIKAIVLRVDSPGGGVAPSQEIYREIQKVKERKKVVASLGSVAASGGYYAASAADGIMASPGTLTGSIGVILEYANIREILDKIGLSPVVIKSGEYKDMGSPVRDLTDRERLLLQEIADEIHGQFVTDVARGRGLDQEAVASLADGRVYTGKKAMELSLVDRMGNLEDAVAWAGELAGIDEEARPVYPAGDRITLLKKMVESVFKEAYISGTLPDYLRLIVN
jgi:protease-4